MEKTDLVLGVTITLAVVAVIVTVVVTCVHREGEDNRLKYETIQKAIESSKGNGVIIIER